MERKKLLMIDDMQVNRTILRVMLEDDYDILEAGDGSEGLELLRTHRDDVALILLDVIMPGMDGYEFLSRVQEDGELARIPVIFITADPDTPELRTALRYGLRDVVAKPIVPRLLTSRVETLIAVAKKRQMYDVLPAGGAVLVAAGEACDRVTLQRPLLGRYRVLEAATGRDALWMWETHEDDLAAVILCAKSTEMDAFQVMEMAKQLDLSARVPVIAAMPGDTKKRMNELLDLGVREVVEEPSVTEILACRVDHMAERFRIF